MAEEPLELLAEDAVDDEVDRGVEGDEQVGDVVHPNVFDAQHLDGIIRVAIIEIMKEMSIIWEP